VDFLALTNTQSHGVDVSVIADKTANTRQPNLVLMS
jgi:hypothetical protein